MMVLALASSTVEAKKCKAKKNSKNSQVNLAATSDSSVSSSGSYTGGNFFKYGKVSLATRRAFTVFACAISCTIINGFSSCRPVSAAVSLCSG